MAEGSSAGARGARACTSCWSGMCLGQSWLQSEFQTTPSLPPPGVPVMAALTLFGCCARSQPAPSPTTEHSSQQWRLSPYWGAVLQSRRCQTGLSTWARVYAGAIVGNRPESWAVSVCFLCFVLGASKNMCTLHKQSPSFTQPLCQSSWSSDQPRELIFLVLDPRTGVPSVWFKPFTPQGDLPAYVILPSFCVISLGHRY